MFSILDIPGKISYVVQKVCCAIKFRVRVINLNIAKQSDKRWSFSHCFGAMEGKYITIKVAGVSSHFIIQEYLIALFISCCSDQITEVCTQILMQALLMVLYGSKID